MPLDELMGLAERAGPVFGAAAPDLSALLAHASPGLPGVLWAADSGGVDPLLAVPPVAIAAATLAFLGWNRRRRRGRKEEFAELQRELARKQELLGERYALRPEGQLWRRSRGRGQITILVVGSFSANQLPYVLRAFVRAGAEEHVGIIYLLELDADRRQMCLDTIPAPFRERVVVADYPLLPGGGGGAPPAEVLDGQELWGYDVLEGGRTWLRRIQAETDPALLLVLLSPGGMAAMGYPVLEAYHERYPGHAIYVASILDHKTVVRRRFPQIRALYSRGGLIRGWILMDNRRASERSDLGIALLFAAMVGATWVDALPLELWNGAAYVFPGERPGGFATLSVWAEMLPVRYEPGGREGQAEGFYTRAAVVAEKALRGIKAVTERPELQSLPLVPAEPGSTRLCYVIAPIQPQPDFRALAQRVSASLEGWRLRSDPDLLLHYASIAAPLGPTTQETPLVVVLLQGLAAGGEAIDALALGAGVDPKFLSGPRDVRIPAAPIPTNGARGREG